MSKLIHRPFYFIRHGQTDWNLLRKFQGQIDIPLNNTGIMQAHDCSEIVKNLPITFICHSPLIRAKETAQVINKYLNAKLIEIDNLKECYLGAYEGQVHGDWVKDWKNGILVENLESFEQFKNRVLIGINQSLAYGENVLIVSHGAVYWAVQQIINYKDNFELQNCSPVYHQPIEHDQPYWITSDINNSFDTSEI